MLRGHCLCGAVRYELDAELSGIVACHCQYCRRAHGAAFVPISWIPRPALHFVAGEADIEEYETPGVGFRAFCRRCGTRLYNRAASSSEFVSLIVGSLEQDPPYPPLMHLNVESKAGWYEIADGRPEFRALPPEAALGESEDSD